MVHRVVRYIDEEWALLLLMNIAHRALVDEVRDVAFRGAARQAPPLNVVSMTAMEIVVITN